MKHDASQSRYLRKKHADQGLDQEEQEEQKEFGQDLQKALDTFGKKEKKKNIESQVEYFGNMIEPFNMREEQQMGDIDQDGYFVFKRRGEYRDAWLESIEEGNDMMVADKVKKKIKTEGVTFKGVYDEDRHGDKADDVKINQVEEEEENDQNEDNENYDKLKPNNQDSQQSQKGLELQPSQIKQLICELLPMNKSANAYIKELKKKIKDPQTKQLHDKILQLCNLYIEKTNEYDILTAKREQLEVEIGVEAGEKSEEIDWDDDGQDENEEQQRNYRKQKIEETDRNKKNVKDTKIKKNTKKQLNEGNYSDDDIF